MIEKLLTSGNVLWPKDYGLSLFALEGPVATSDRKRTLF